MELLKADYLAQQASVLLNSAVSDKTLAQKPSLEQDPTLNLCSNLKERVFQASQDDFSSHFLLLVLDCFGLLEKFFLAPAVDKCLEAYRIQLYPTFVMQNIDPPKWLYTSDRISHLPKQRQLYQADLIYRLNESFNQPSEQMIATFDLHQTIRNQFQLFNLIRIYHGSLIQNDLVATQPIYNQIVGKYSNNRETKPEELPPIPDVLKINPLSEDQLIELFFQKNPDLSDETPFADIDARVTQFITEILQNPPQSNL